jgi:CDP-glycerol glycerophosphotransferase
VNEGPPTLSVVVPVYNVEEYLDECLASIACSTWKDLEVVMVDDGSTDDSATIARGWAERDERFFLVQQENRGLGAARNAGIPHARGRYLAFLDSDDKVPEAAYERMITTLERTGSDLATGNVHRFDGQRVWQAPLTRGVHDRTRLRTHVSRDHELLRDLLAHNKVWRRTFWDDHDLAFPVGVLYEDLPVTIPAHVMATSVDVLADVVDLWRYRTTGLASITQEKAASARQVKDRMAGVISVSRFMAEHADADLKDRYDLTALERDVRYFVDVLPDVDVEYRHTALEAFRAFLAQVSPEVLPRVVLRHRLKYDLIRRGEVDRLLAYLHLQRAGDLDALVYRQRGGRVHSEAPALGPGDPITFAPAVLDVTDELTLVSRVTAVELDDDELRIEGWAYIDRVLVEDEDATELRITLEGERGSFAFDVSRHNDVRATHDAGHPRVAYDWAGFVATLPLKKLRPRGRRLRRRWFSGTWTVRAHLSSGPLQVSGEVSRPTSGRAERTHVRELRADGKQLRISWTNEWALQVAIGRPPPTIVGIERSGEEMVLELRIDPPPVAASYLTLSDSVVGTSRRYPVTRLSDDGAAAVRVPLSDVIDQRTAVKAPGGLGELRRWTVKYHRRQGEGAAKVAAAARTGGDRIPFDDVEVAVHRNRSGLAAIVHRPVAARLRAARWQGATLHIDVDHPGPTRPSAVLLRHVTRTEHVEWADLRPRPGGFSAELDLGSVSRFAENIPLRSGSWLLETLIEGRRLPIMPSEDALAAFPIRNEHAGRQVVIEDRRWHRVSVDIGSELADDEHGAYHQRRLREVVYPELLGTPLRDAVVYDCYLGKQFGDSPQAIFEELVARRVDLEHLVLVRDQQVDVPAPAVAVPMWSKKAYEALATSRYVVSNTHLPPYFRRAPGQTVVQTWHGIGLKRVGLDIDKVQFANQHYQRNILTEAENTDYVISPNPFNSPILRRAFAVQGELLETGVPRNDVFFRPDRDELVARIRRAIGLDEGQRAVLYAPTWRDDVHRGGQYRLDLRLDLARVAETLGPDHVVLFRKHANIVDKLPPDSGPNVIDVSDYPEVQHILLVSDVLITDYSTLMFDYANTGHPMLFYTYDLDRYRDVLRGFYFDFESEAPGPLLTTQDELLSALSRIDETHAGHASAYREFVARFCAWDDGKAARRVVDAVFAGDERVEQ